VADAPYPRADPAEAAYLPADVWDAAQLPVGVRLEMVGDARTIRVWYKTTRASLGYRGESAGCRFVAYRAGQKVAEADAVMGEGMAELVMSGRTDLPVTIYFPEGMQPIVTGVEGIEETIVPAPLQPRWLAYGDAVTQGWLASAPAMAWPAVAGRKLGLDVCNLGYAGTARPETTSALMLAETPAEVISIAFGLNNWSRVPHTEGLMAEEVRCFLSIVREGHPDLPIVVVSPTARPDAEDVPNRVGATLSQLRRAMEQTVLDAISRGDEKLFLVSGLAVVDPEHLEDGLYPGDEGHRRIAAAVSKILVPHLRDLQMTAEKRWAGEGNSVTAASHPSVITETPVPRWTTLNDAIFTAVPPDGPSPNGLAEIPDAVNTAPLNTAPLNTAPLNTAPVNDAPVENAPVENAQVNSAQVNSAQAETGLVNNAPVETAPVDTTLVDTTLGDATSIDNPPVNAAPVNTAPVNTAPVNTAPVNTAPVNTAPVNTAPVDTTPVDTTPVDTTPVNNDARGEQPKAAAPKFVVKDGRNADIGVADMVVAALSMATNGADDIVDGQAPGPTEELQWTDTEPTEELQWTDTEPTDSLQWTDTEPTDSLQWTDTEPTDSLQWTDTEPTDSLQWTDTEPTDSLQWTDPVPAESAQWDIPGAESLEEFQWTEPVPTEELQWTAPAPTEELQWTEPAPTESLQWVDQVPAESLEWAEPVPVESLEWAEPGPVEELEWSVAAEPGPG
jgi:lysophospholipase L1-like esterase